jgi:ATP adenylyltransferase
MTNPHSELENLKSFLEERMKMSHIYQPLLIKALIDSGGQATVRQLAQTFLNYDESQIKYYEDIIKKMPVKVLKDHGVIDKEKELISLRVKKMSLKEKSELRRICEEKIHAYIEKRGLGIWDHRFNDSSYISGSLYYRVLKESGGKCALCGTPKQERPLDVDHIIPRSIGGKTEYENLQALSYKCNRSRLYRRSTLL